MLIMPTSDYIKVLHRLLIEYYIEEGERITPGYMNEGMIQGSIERAMTDIYDFIPFPHIMHKATILLESIIRFHPFVDGNKRTALLATYYFFGLNGYHFKIPENSVEFTVRIADPKAKVSLNEILTWMHNNCRFSLRLLFLQKLLSFALEEKAELSNLVFLILSSLAIGPMPLKRKEPTK